MVMTDFEIRREYRQARYPEKQIAILAQLNGCHVNDIRDILNGVSPKKPRKVFMHTSNEDKLELYNQGMNDYEIGRALNIASTSVCYWRKKNGLKAIGKRRNQDEY